MRNNLLLSAAFLCVNIIFAQNPSNQPPVISNFSASADWPSNTLTLTYDVADAENDPLEITLAFSINGGQSYTLNPPVSVSGDTGFPVTPGMGKTITCDVSALAGMPNKFTVRIVADDKQAFDIQQLVNEVDSMRLIADMEFVEGIRHRTTGLNHLNEVRDSLNNLFAYQELALTEQSFPFGTVTGENIIGSFPGTASVEKVVIVDAHYDTVDNAPGADDNGSGVVGVMEIARLLSRYPTKKTVRYIGFDLEEEGLRGSIAYNSNIPTGEQIEGVFNFEMIGYYSEQPNSQEIPNGFAFFFPDAVAQINANQNKGDFITNVANSNCQPLALLFSNAAAEYVPDLKVITLVALGNGSSFLDLLRSDHAPFWFANRPALMLTDGADFRNDCYHTPMDVADGKLNFTFMSNVVKATLAAAAELAEIQHGDWAIASFEGTVSTSVIPDCRLAVWQSPNNPGILNFSVANCLFTQAYVEILDEKGSVVHSESLVLNDSGQQYGLALPNLSAGMYFAKIAWPGGMRTEKFVVTR